jgi:hypothetical protein
MNESERFSSQPFSTAYIVARLAHPFAVWMRLVMNHNYYSVLRRIWMPLRAMRPKSAIAVMATFFDRISYIVALRTDKNAFWVEASRRIAFVQRLKPAMQRHPMNEVRYKPMNKNSFSEVGNGRVFSICTSRPNPTSTFIHSERIAQSHGEYFNTENLPCQR